MRSRPTRLAATIVAALLIALEISAVAGPGSAAAPNDLFISEYVEGSSNNKAIELFNGTGAPIDLRAGAYTLKQYSNGSPSAGPTTSLSGTLAAGDVHVFAHSSSNAAILAQADQTSGSGLFNGNDAIVLSRGGTVLDVVGQVGFDPGAQWGTGLTSTADNTLRRQSDICVGDSDGTNAFDPGAEFDGFAEDTFVGLGAHTTDCGGEPPAPPVPVLNEFSASTDGIDVEFVEIHGDPATDYSGYSVVEIEGDSGPATATGTVDEVISLRTTDVNGVYLASLPANALENGTLTLLLVQGFTGALNNDLDTDDNGRLDATPWTTVVDAVAVDDGGSGDLTYGVPVLGGNYDGLSAFHPGGASRLPDGTDTDAAADWVRNDFDKAGIPGNTGTPVEGEALHTPGAPNQAYTPPPIVDTCETATTPTYEIQGSDSASPLAGQSVLTEGVVVGEFQNGADDTIYIQDALGDGNVATSDGLYVFDDAESVQVGQTVRVRGTVQERFGLTSISSVQKIFGCSVPVLVDPVELSLPVVSADDFEAYEGMLVTFPQDLVISEYFNYGRFGELVLTDERQFTPTAVVEPGAPAIALAAEQALGRITLDDGRSAQNPDPARHPDGDAFTLDNLFRGGDLLTDVTGVMDYQFARYRIQPTQGAEHTVTNPRMPAPEVGGTLEVASFNVLNYFTTFAPAGRGADNEAELVRQEDKIVAAMAQIDADVFGLMEIENNTEAIERLVGALNAEVGADTYDYVDTGVIGTDAIKVAFLYKPGTVSLVGGYEVLDASDDPRFDTTRNRPALAQTFREKATNEVVTIAVNHLKSKGSACLGDPNTGDGSGNCNVTRTEAAKALADWLDDDPTASGSNRKLIIGDLNSYDKEDPIDAILAAGYTDLVAEFGGELAYGYVFDGKVGYLDHALANEELAPLVTGATEWHLNADEPSLIDYDLSFKQDAQDALYAPDPYRSSDHDAVVVGLALDAVAPELTVTLSPNVLRPPNHEYVTVEASVSATDSSGQEPTIELVSVTSNEPDNGTDDGNTVDDIMIVDDTTFRLRAERSRVGTGRVYTVTYSATDATGNVTTESATVTVPVGRGR